MSFTMNCIRCDMNVEESGGSQLEGCFHFLCPGCLTEAIRETEVEGISCPLKREDYKCHGYLRHEELQFMASKEILAEYTDRISSFVRLRPSLHSGEETGKDSSPSIAESTTKAPSPPQNLKLNMNSGRVHKATIIDHLIKFGNLEDASAAGNYVDQQPILETIAVTSCAICGKRDIAAGDGVILKECLHIFCKFCLQTLIRTVDTAAVLCPFKSGDFHCDKVLAASEMHALVGEEECRRHLIDLRLRDETRCTKCGVIHSGSCEEYWKKVEEEEEVQRSRERNMEFMEDTQDKNGDVDVVDFAVSPSMESKIFLRCVRCNFVVRGMDDSIKICKKVKGKPHRFRNFGALTLIVSN